MAHRSSDTRTKRLEVVLRDGVSILAILLVWGILATILTEAVDGLGIPGEEFVTQVGNFLLWTGVLNAILYLVYRSIDHYHATT